MLTNLAVALEREGIDWAVTGAVAANYYRDQIRTSSDLDILLSLADNDVDKVANALQSHGWISINEIMDGLLRAEHPVFGRLDVLIAATDYDVGAIARARKEELKPNRTCKTLAIEDVLIANLMAYQFSNCADVESILFRNPELDWDYLLFWLDAFDLEDRLKRIVETTITAGRIRSKLSGKSVRSDFTADDNYGTRH